jgi:hypothetical protein
MPVFHHVEQTRIVVQIDAGQNTSTLAAGRQHNLLPGYSCPIASQYEPKPLFNKRGQGLVSLPGLGFGLFEEPVVKPNGCSCHNVCLDIF